LEQAQKQHKTAANEITKEDLFYYVYGFLHSPEYRAAFANDLKTNLPRLFLVEAVEDFWSFSQAGRRLADLHLNYENVPPHPQITVKGQEYGNYIVNKMRFAEKGRKDKIIYNSFITLSNIPEQAYAYVINGKSAIEWVMNCYQVSTHKESQITNDPNHWAAECGNPRYILDLLLSVIHVSTQTMEIIAQLPKLNLDPIENGPENNVLETTDIQQKIDIPEKIDNQEKTDIWKKKTVSGKKKISWKRNGFKKPLLFKKGGKPLEK
jgi:predicted helicase